MFLQCIYTPPYSPSPVRFDLTCFRPKRTSSVYIDNCWHLALLLLYAPHAWVHPQKWSSNKKNVQIRDNIETENNRTGDCYFRSSVGIHKYITGTEIHRFYWSIWFYKRLWIPLQLKILGCHFCLWITSQATVMNGTKNAGGPAPYTLCDEFRDVCMCQKEGQSGRWRRQFWWGGGHLRSINQVAPLVLIAEAPARGSSGLMSPWLVMEE